MAPKVRLPSPRRFGRSSPPSRISRSLWPLIFFGLAICCRQNSLMFMVPPRDLMIEPQAPFLEADPRQRDEKFVQQNEVEPISACLLIKDDNDKLVEWLAYHYHVLPLRHLVVAVDPDSKSTPLSVLQRYDHTTDLEYVLWQDQDYINGTKLLQRQRRKKLATDQLRMDKEDVSREMTALHDERQLLFLSECYQYHKRWDRQWVIHIDTDEYVTFNRPDAHNDPVVANKNEITVDRSDLPSIGESTVSEMINNKVRSLGETGCISMVRLLFGSLVKSGRSLLDSTETSPSSVVNPDKFDTLRFLHHFEKDSDEGNFHVHMPFRLNGLGKAIVDVSAFTFTQLEVEKIFSIHRPSVKQCPPAHGPVGYSNSVLRVNHYLGTWESYISRGDVSVRRSKAIFDIKANASSMHGPSTDTLPWLDGFINEVGPTEAVQLLADAEELAPQEVDALNALNAARKPCALLFFGVGRKFKDIALPSIKKHVLAANPHCDVFVHSYNVTMAFDDAKSGKGFVDVNEILLLGDGEAPRVDFIFETEKDFRRHHDLKRYRPHLPRPSAWTESNMDNMIRQWNSIQKVWMLMEANERRLRERYGRVGLFRLDVRYKHAINIDEGEAVIPTMMYKPTIWDGYNDRMFYGDRPYAEIWATQRFNTVPHYLENQRNYTDTSEKRGIHSEDFMRYLIGQKYPLPLTTKEICFQRIRSSGLIYTWDCDTVKAHLTPSWRPVPGVVVLGMLRSGTSMLTGLLVEALSFVMPGQQVTAADTSQNAKGFFEVVEVMKQNDQWLDEQNMTWDQVGMITHSTNSSVVIGGFDSLRAGSLSIQGERAIQKYNNPINRPWVMKDPRQCFTLPAWLPWIAAEEAETALPAVLFTYRNPYDVARSLYVRKRNSVPLLNGFKLWIWYNREAIQISSGLCRIVTSNDAIVKNPQFELTRISNELEERCDLESRSLLVENVSDFVDTDLQHGEFATSDVSGISDGKAADACLIPPYKRPLSSYATNSAVTSGEDELLIAHEKEVYEKAMQVFCDLNNRKAFNPDYVWPVLN